MDKKYTGNGLGADMLVRSLTTFRQAVMDMGIPVMTLVPLRESLVEFYQERGFVRYAQHLNERRMMLTAHEALRAADEAETE